MYRKQNGFAKLVLICQNFYSSSLNHGEKAQENITKYILVFWSKCLSMSKFRKQWKYSTASLLVLLLFLFNFFSNDTKARMEGTICLFEYKAGKNRSNDENDQWNQNCNPDSLKGFILNSHGANRFLQKPVSLCYCVSCG